MKASVLVMLTFALVFLSPSRGNTDCSCTVYSDCNPGPFWNDVYNETHPGSSAADCAALEYGSGACVSGIGGPDIRDCSWDGNR